MTDLLTNSLSRINASGQVCIIGCGAELGEASDPRSCCAEVGVSPVCRAWCGAREADLDLSYSAEICAMSYAEKIMG